MADIEVKQVRSKGDLKSFVTFPWTIYQNDPNWVPPLIQERVHFLSGKGPYFHHAKVQYWTAWQHGRMVGRISAQIDQLFQERHNDNTGFWGMFESIDDLEVFKALFDRAFNWLASQGMTRAWGPFNLSINQECGLLVKGFTTPPSIMMGHAPPYYGNRLEMLGHKKVKDLLAYMVEKDPEQLNKIHRLLGSNRNRFKTRPLNKSRLSQELDEIFTIFNKAWAKNWGFVPFTREEYMDLGKTMSLVTRPEYVRIIELNGKGAGFIAVLPNLHEIIKDLNGRLLPFGWLKLLWRIRFHSFRSARVVLMGILPEYQEKMVGAAMTLSLIRDVMAELLKTGIQQVELSWILEDNLSMRRIIEALGVRAYKVYRIYEKPI